MMNRVFLPDNINDTLSFAENIAEDLWIDKERDMIGETRGMERYEALAHSYGKLKENVEKALVVKVARLVDNVDIARVIAQAATDGVAWRTIRERW